MFWKPDPTPPDLALYRALNRAHSESAGRENASSYAVLNAYSGSGDYVQAIAAALMTLGGHHAPLADTYDMLCHEHPAIIATGALARGRKVIGWGNSFIQGSEDEIWADVKRILVENWPEIAHKIQAVTEVLHKHGKMIHPNPSAYTAGAALALGCPREVLPFLFISARLAAWSEIIMSTHHTLHMRKAA